MPTVVEVNGKKYKLVPQGMCAGCVAENDIELCKALPSTCGFHGYKVYKEIPNVD